MNTNESDVTGNDLPKDESISTKMTKEECPVETLVKENPVETLTKEKEMLEDKLARIMADFQNLEKQTHAKIQNSVAARIGEIFVDMLSIRDDFERARDSFTESGKDATGLDSVLKNISSMFSKYEVLPMDDMGEIFDPKLHEAISVIEDDILDENTITKVIRKGYILHNKVVRTSLVEISKKPVVE
ncbi:MAG: GrpE protein [Cenarchaeum symbiont of Oopsacas minuta]|nr:GrpE protein [Cenarchaeum symbiont of Oopsacas minuta]